MRIILLIFFSISCVFGIEHKIELSVGGMAYRTYANEFVTQAKGSFGFENDLFSTHATLECLYSSSYKQRRYCMVNELYIIKDFSEYSLHFGKEIKYFGELEGYNIADFYNQKNYLKDPFDKSAKYGNVGADITHYFGDNSITFGMKLYEEGLEYPQNNTPYTPFALSYDKDLYLSASRYTPTPYIAVSIVDDSFIESETQLIFLHGYDTKRSFIFTTPTQIAQYAYRVNKGLLLAHIIYNDTLYKTELGYTDVLDNSMMSDYTQLSFGVEQSLYDLVGCDMTVYVEYYAYLYSDDTKIKNVDISEIYDNDLFVALRVAFEDAGSTELKLGVLEDFQKDQSVWKIEAKSRFFQHYILSGSYLGIFAKKDQTLLGAFANTNRLEFSIAYTF